MDKDFDQRIIQAYQSEGVTPKGEGLTLDKLRRVMDMLSSKTAQNQSSGK